MNHPKLLPHPIVVNVDCTWPHTINLNAYVCLVLCYYSSSRGYNHRKVYKPNLKILWNPFISQHNLEYITSVWEFEMFYFTVLLGILSIYLLSLKSEWMYFAHELSTSNFQLKFQFKEKLFTKIHSIDSI